MNWLKERWKWIVAGLAMLGAILFGLLSRRKSPVVIPPVDEKQREVERETQEKQKELEAKKIEELDRIQKEHAQTVEKLNEQQKERYEELKENPDELSNWLLELGKKNRG